MKISIKNSGAKLITLNVNESDTTENIKLKIQEQEGIPLEK